MPLCNPSGVCGACVYLKPKIIILTLGPPSPSTTPIAPIGGILGEFRGGGHLDGWMSGRLEGQGQPKVLLGPASASLVCAYRLGRSQWLSVLR